jgi:hypothetical protein
LNIPDHISESLKPFFGLKILKFFDENPDPAGIRNLFDPGSGMEKFGPGSRINIPDPQNCSLIYADPQP